MQAAIQLGFTGTRHGMTDAQGQALETLLASFTNVQGFHHGDCRGADAQAHALARTHGWAITLHPPIMSGCRAFCPGSTTTRAALHFLDRNHAIVRAADILIATPATVKEEERGSGTWATVRFARKQHKPIYIIYPDGQVVREG